MTLLPGPYVIQNNLSNEQAGGICGGHWQAATFTV